MKISRDRAAANRDGVVEAASKLFRDRGVDGVGIDAVMAAAGLTAGGFYKTFGSKEDLVVEAFAAALESTVDGLRRTEATDGTVWQAFVDSYLCPQHRDGRAEGCALVALSADAGRRKGSTSEVFAKGVDAFIGSVGDILPASSQARRREEAVMATAAMVGALTLARAVGIGALSEELMQTVRSSLLLLSSAHDRPENPEP
ncbi:TetR/AcrR family transcriptional regulator [Beijerinckia sp. L45]|uniref:TetR/AcrR family transcriptional regulator n=1 Tax=Beijerinckia sp. L45 TaxID=1641855 RepID=UPI00131B5C1F|nr:TetR/AcrR family transcriptional regulator [Beijerinckia sp. L45]